MFGPSLPPHQHDHDGDHRDDGDRNAHVDHGVVRGALLSANDPQLMEAANRLQFLDASLFAIGAAIVVLAFFWDSYGRGSFSRRVLGLGVAVLGVLWTYIDMGGGC